MLVVFSTILLIGLGSLIIIPTVQAEELVDQKNQNQVTEISDYSSKSNQERTQIEDKLANLKEQMARMDQAIQDNQNFILKTEQDIAVANNDILQLEDEINVLNEQIEKRNQVLKERALSYQESGRNVSYVDVLLGSTSFSNFVERVGAVAKIVKADQELIDQHEVDKRNVENKQDLLEKKLADLTNMQTELNGMQAQLSDQQNENNLVKEQLQKKRHSLQLESVDAIPTMAMNEGANPSVTTVTQAGYRYIGNSVYVFGGGRNEYDIENGRFDCSAFVHWAFAQAGIDIGSTTDMLKNSGTQMDASQMQPGDLVFFDTYKKDGHVGIYLGEGKFIGSQSSTGVAIADMLSGYWNETFNGRVVRLIPD